MNGQIKRQAYETLIAEGITAGDLKDLGTYYLHESDKQVEAPLPILTIVPKSRLLSRLVNSRNSLEGDFGRNHTWIVYAYFNYAKGLEVVTVKVNDWEERDPETHDVYNW